VAEPVAGLVLAAGAGRRFGMPKALVRHRGRLFVEYATGVLRSAGCRPVLAVLGASADQVRAEADLAGVRVVSNVDWTSGMGSSLRAGLVALAEAPEPVAVIVLPVDTPGVTVAAVARLSALAAPDALARATYHGVPGHPVLIGRDHWVAIRDSAAGDEGARSYFRAHPPLDVPCADVADGRDVDRPEDLPPA
jgi:CTP:molybdopterin cytidylyltransferase MocA